MASKVAWELATELGFNKQHRRLRCCGHIINLVARSILFGTDADAFEEDCQADKELQDEMRLWRAKGPIGKLHNIAHWVQRSGQRIDKLHKLQSIENTALGLEDRSTYDVITDNATRWNASETMMERGYQLRNPLDSLVQAEVTEWDQYVAMRMLENPGIPLIFRIQTVSLKVLDLKFKVLDETI
ncbi:hypothetical protein Focb16_v006247 [Fusarium oxysporum f. sp. cubense]|uniref:Uncharacterized protein n=1 Tax=Fusarium oxysporum f. sp. cubense TaxID=61366 RepID=A0A559LI66_FUSOC|nr:hypothetical protein Focb16_v006247 [Fusarium oxysporum f. sp. cubense]